MANRLFPSDYYQVCTSTFGKKEKERWFCNRPLSPIANASVEEGSSTSISVENTDVQNDTITSSDQSLKIDDSVLSNDKERMSPDFSEQDDQSNETDPEYCPSNTTETDSDESFHEEHDIVNEPSERPAEKMISPTVSNFDGENRISLNNDIYYGKRRRQKDFCMFCETLVQCFARHVIRNHSREVEVQKMLSYPPKHKERKKLITILRKKGNYINSSQIQKAVKKSVLGEELLPCCHCFGLYSRTQLWRHRRTCNTNVSTKNSQVDAQNFLLRHYKIDEELKQKVFPRMRPDKISLMAKTDTLICAFGARYLKIHREAHFVNVASRKMRELARLIIEVKKIKPELKNLFEILKPENFDIIIGATKNVAKYDSDKKFYKSPTYAMNIATSLKQCCDIAIMTALKKKDMYANVKTAEVEADLKTLIHLINENWKFEVSSQAGNDLNINKWNKVTIIPLATDLKLLRNYLIEKGNEAASKLINFSGREREYKVLIETVYCRIILLNRRRPGELQRLLLSTYENLSTNNKQNYEEFEAAVSPGEKILMQKFKRLVIRGKRGRGVPVLLSTDVQEHIELLLKHRVKYLKKKNLYFFPNISSSEPISGYKVLKKYATSCGAKNPDGITCTRLRKHLATLSQVFNMSESDLEQLATFMGHTIGIHRQSYRLPDDVYQTSKIAKILLLMEKGTVGEFKGKTLEEINIDMEEDLLAENSATENGIELTEIEPVDDMESNINNASTVSGDLATQDENEKEKSSKKSRVLVKWTEKQKNVVSSYFVNHIKQKKPPKRAECEDLKEKHKELLKNKDWLKIKVYVQNKYSGKCK